MIDLHLDELNTFGKGRWEFLPSALSCAKDYELNCKKLYKYSQNTPLCLCNMKNVQDGLQENCFFVFLDNENHLQIVGNLNGYGDMDGLRGVADGIEQNIDLRFLDVANEFCDKNVDVRFCASWKHKINWLESLRKYNDLFEEKRYKEIDVASLIDDLGYNGYDLHYKDCTEDNKKRIYYPIIKRKLFRNLCSNQWLQNIWGATPMKFLLENMLAMTKRLNMLWEIASPNI